MTSPLERLAGPGKSLAAEPPDAKEFAGLKRSGMARLKDAGNASNSLEGRFDLVYNAAHALCLAALRYHGFRAGNRYERPERKIESYIAPKGYLTKPGMANHEGSHASAYAGFPALRTG
jgi:hypothetical protein